MRIHLIPNSHIDPVWLWDKHEGIDEVISTFRAACDRLDEYPNLTFTASSMQFYEWVHQHDPALFERVARKVAEGRWEIVGGWWVEADTNLPCEASLIKQAEISQDFCRRHFGREITVAYLPDSFGHSATLPRILRGTGFRCLVFGRPSEREKPDLPANLFEWEYDGHRILTYRLKFLYSQGRQLDSTRNLSRLNDAEYVTNPVNCFFFGVGDHGGGPSIEEIEFYNEVIAKRPAGDIGYSTCLRFFEEAAGRAGIPVYSGDLHMHAVGCYSVMRDLKNAMRRCEQGLQFAARALDISGESDECLKPAWKATLFNQFHDILPGSCSPDAADQAIAELGGVQSICRDTAYRALKSRSLTRRALAPQGEFRIFNTLPFDVTVPLHVESFGYYHPNAAFKDEDGNEVAVQEVLPSVRCANRRWVFVDSLPARGFKAYHFDDETLVERAAPDRIHFRPIEESRPAPRHRVDGEIIAPERWGDALRGIIDAPMRFLLLSDESDTWGHGVERYDSVVAALELVHSAGVSGPVTNQLYQRWSCGSSTLEAIYATYRGLPGVFVEYAATWAEKRRILKVEIRPPGAGAPDILMQGAGGPIVRRADGKELPLHHWVWIPTDDGGLAAVQDGAFACDCADGRLRLTFVRSSVYAYHDPVQLDPGDPQRFTDQGEHRLRLRLLHRSSLDVAELDRLAGAFLEPYVVIRETRQESQRP